ncbi:hypothetical protein [Ammoniphilus sp. 3BR4]|uniref:hypothetical protein n=1 Tax=Ammoniphilus sp. 3BR4 TaxID=3158265 RepID=UPI003465EC61
MILRGEKGYRKDLLKILEIPRDLVSGLSPVGAGNRGHKATPIGFSPFTACLREQKLKRKGKAGLQKVESIS